MGLPDPDDTWVLLQPQQPLTCTMLPAVHAPGSCPHIWVLPVRLNRLSGTAPTYTLGTEPRSWFAPNNNVRSDTIPDHSGGSVPVSALPCDWGTQGQSEAEVETWPCGMSPAVKTCLKVQDRKRSERGPARWKASTKCVALECGEG